MDEDANQIDSGANKLDGREAETAVDDHRNSEESHEDYNRSEEGEPTSSFVNPYEDEDLHMLEINSKSKAKCLKKVIQEKTKLSKSNILFYRITKDKEKGIVL